MLKPKPLIAIDGVAGAGKTTATASVAAELGLTQVFGSSVLRLMAYEHIQHGDMARTRLAASQYDPSVLFTAATQPHLRSEVVAKVAGALADDAHIYPQILRLYRQAYLDLPATARGLIAEGRGMTNEVFEQHPFDAGVKIYMTADLPVRLARMNSADAADVMKRDASDMQRAFFKLAVAPTAVVLDTTQLDATQTHERLRTLTLARYPQLA